MSHFVVLVTETDEETLKKQLAPFAEDVRKNSIYAEKVYEIEKNKKSVDDWFKKEIQEYEEICTKNKDEWCSKNLNELRDAQSKNFREKCRFIKEWSGYLLDNKGFYYVENPNAKWDWWVEGGRWDKWLVKKDGTRCNRCLVGEVDFDGMKRAEIEDHSKYYDDQIAKAKEEERKPYFWGFEDTPTKEEWMAKFKPWICPYAILHEGEWMEKGEMGWWGIDDPHYTDEEWDEKFQKFIKELDPETEITIVDCHI